MDQKISPSSDSPERLCQAATAGLTASVEILPKVPSSKPHDLEQHIKKIISQNKAIIETLDPLWSKKYMSSRHHSTSSIPDDHVVGSRLQNALLGQSNSCSTVMSQVSQQQQEQQEFTHRSSLDSVVKSVPQMNTHSSDIPASGSLVRNLLTSNVPLLYPNHSALGMNGMGKKRVHAKNNILVENPEKSVIKDLLLKAREKDNTSPPMNQMNSTRGSGHHLPGTSMPNSLSLFPCPTCKTNFRDRSNLEAHQLHYCEPNQHENHNNHLNQKHPFDQNFNVAIGNIGTTASHANHTHHYPSSAFAPTIQRKASVIEMNPSFLHQRLTTDAKEIQESLRERSSLGTILKKTLERREKRKISEPIFYTNRHSIPITPLTASPTATTYGISKSNNSNAVAHNNEMTMFSSSRMATKRTAACIEEEESTIDPFKQQVSVMLERTKEKKNESTTTSHRISDVTTWDHHQTSTPVITVTAAISTPVTSLTPVYVPFASTGLTSSSGRSSTSLGDHEVKQALQMLPDYMPHLKSPMTRITLMGPIVFPVLERILSEDKDMIEFHVKDPSEICVKGSFAVNITPTDAVMQERKRASVACDDREETTSSPSPDSATAIAAAHVTLLLPDENVSIRLQEGDKDTITASHHKDDQSGSHRDDAAADPASAPTDDRGALSENSSRDSGIACFSNHNNHYNNINNNKSQAILHVPSKDEESENQQEPKPETRRESANRPNSLPIGLASDSDTLGFSSDSSSHASISDRSHLYCLSSDSSLITSNIVSPDTPRTEKNIFQQYLNGHAYTFIGLKTSTRSTYCCIYRPQPMFVTQETDVKLSMYSNWRTSSQVHDAIVSDVSPRGLLSSYDSNYLKNKNPIVIDNPPLYVLSNKCENMPGSIGTKTTDSQYWISEAAKLDDMFKFDLDDSNRKISNCEDANDQMETEEAPFRKISEDRTSSTSFDSDGDQPKRVKIFEGGFKSSEDYTYVRGRGRGKYVCEECGIRCKKPSMLKKHIRTHTDLRPYSCRHCAFAFKTKGNLTKHMKSKAHHKKCVELGIDPVPIMIDDSQIDSDALAKQEAMERNCNGGNLMSDGSEMDDDDEYEDDIDSDDEGVPIPLVNNSYNNNPVLNNLSNNNSLIKSNLNSIPASTAVNVTNLSTSSISGQAADHLNRQQLANMDSISLMQDQNRSARRPSVVVMSKNLDDHEHATHSHGNNSIKCNLNSMPLVTHVSNASTPQTIDLNCTSRQQQTNMDSMSLMDQNRSTRRSSVVVVSKNIEEHEVAQSLLSLSGSWTNDNNNNNISRNTTLSPSNRGSPIKHKGQAILLHQQHQQHQPTTGLPVKRKMSILETTLEAPWNPYTYPCRTRSYSFGGTHDHLLPSGSKERSGTWSIGSKGGVNDEPIDLSRKMSQPTLVTDRNERIPVSGMTVADDTQSYPRQDFVPIPLSSGSEAGEGKCVCSFCNEVFPKPSALRLHVYAHYIERPYRCNSCAVSFRTSGHLKKHKRSSSHINKLNMNKTFGTPTNDNPRPFKCSDCKVAFRIHGHLAKHLRSKLHIMKLECLNKLPFGMYAEMERTGLEKNLALIDTSNCENSLISVQSLSLKMSSQEGSTLDLSSIKYQESMSDEDDDDDDEGMPLEESPSKKAKIPANSCNQHDINNLSPVPQHQREHGNNFSKWKHMIAERYRVCL